MNHVSLVPGLRVTSIAATLPLWEALGFELAFAFAGEEWLAEGSLEGATFARLDAPTRQPISVFLDTQRGAVGATVHLMLSHEDEVDETAGRLEAAGVAIAQAATDQPWGMRDLQVVDGDGNVVIVGAALAS